MSAYLVLKDFKGAIQGCYVKQFEAETTVEIDDADLVAVALAKGWVTPVDDLSGAPEPEKAAESAPKNKARKAAPSKKAITGGTPVPHSSAQGGEDTHKLRAAEPLPLEGGTRGGLEGDV